jgi:transposase
VRNYNVKYTVRLSKEEREELEGIVKRGKVAAVKRRRAQILLKADARSDGPSLTDEQVAQALSVSTRTVGRVRKAYVEQGLSQAIEPKQPERRRVPKLDGEKEARLIAVACQPAPAGRTRWTLRLLADKLVELEIVDSISKDTVRETLKKTRSSRG